MEQSDQDDHHANQFRLTERELDEITDQVDHGGGHAWGFRFTAAVAAAKRAKVQRRLGPYGDWPEDGH